MNGKTKSTQPSSSEGHRSTSPNIPPAAGSPAQVSPAGDPVLQTEYRALADKHLGNFAGKLFAEITGVRFQIAWMPSLPKPWKGAPLPTGCSSCCQVAEAGSAGRGCCRTCGPRQLARTLRSDGKGHFFTCRLGVRNHWFPIRLRGVTVGIAYVQAPADAKAMSPRWRCRRRKLPGGADPRISSGAKSLSRAEFGRAARLLRFIVQHVQTSSLADLRQTDLTKARLALLELQTVATRLRGELNGLLPAFSKMAPGLEPESHTGRIVHAALEYICGNYGSPLTLQRCAEAVQLNPAYFSSLFAHAVGLPFKTYLTEVRVEKARELLRDPTRNVSEVAYAVGYASENRFRIAFKRVTGLSPTSWRDTLRMPLPTLLMWLLGETELIESLKLFFGL